MKSVTIFFKKITLAKWILLMLSPVIAIIVNMKTMLIALGFIIFMDMITGIRKGLHQKGIPFNPLKAIFWKNVQSAGLRSTWRKTYEYAIGIIVFAVLDGMVLGNIEVALFQKTYSLTQLAVVVACIIEVYSIHENMEAVSGNNLFKTLLKVLPKKISKLFKAITKRRNS